MKTNNTPLDLDFVLEAISYCPESGLFTWKERPMSHFSMTSRHTWFNRNRAGKLAGCRLFTHKTRYPHCIMLIIDQRHVLAHRLAWWISNGKIPDKMVIDHINGNPFDNRLCNLRIATKAQNNRNAKKPSTNTSGLKGTSLIRKTGRWVAQINIKGKRKNLGRYDTREEAHLVYMEAAKQIYGEFARAE